MSTLADPDVYEFAAQMRTIDFRPGTSDPKLLERAKQTALGLGTWNVSHGVEVGIACCDAHRADGAVAYMACLLSGATPVVFSMPIPAIDLRVAADSVAPRVVFACSDLGELWYRSGARGVLISDCPNSYWWKRLETESLARHDMREPSVSSNDAEVRTFSTLRFVGRVCSLDRGQAQNRTRAVMSLPVTGTDPLRRTYPCRVRTIDGNHLLGASSMAGCTSKAGKSGHVLEISYRAGGLEASLHDQLVIVDLQRPQSDRTIN